MRRSDTKWLRSATSLVVLAASLLAALPAVAGTMPFTIDTTTEYLVVTENKPDGLWTSYYLQPANGTMAPFGLCQAIFTSHVAMSFTFANGGTIAASVTLQQDDYYGPTTFTGTITGGTGIFDGASGSFSALLTPDWGHQTDTAVQITFKGSGTVTAPKVPSGLIVLPPVLAFHVAQGATSTVSKTLLVNNEDLTAETFQVSATTASGGDWLSVSPSGGTVAVAATSAIIVTADPTAASPALKPGVYEGLVTVGWAKGSTSTKVHLIVGGMGGDLELSETGLAFQGGEGGYPSHAAKIQVRNDGEGSLDALTAETSVTGSGANWLHAAITPVAGDPQRSDVVISADPLPADAGTYYGRVDFSLPNAANSPQSVTVALEIMPGPLPDITPGGIAFSYNYVCGAPAAAVLAQTVKMTNIGKQTLSFTAASAPEDSPYHSGFPKNGATVDWLAFSPKAGTLGPGGNVILTVQVPAACFDASDPCALYYYQAGSIGVTFKEDSYTARIPLHFSIDNVCDFHLPSGPQGPGGGLTGVSRPAGAAGMAVGSHPRAAASCVPWQLYGLFTSILSGFQATVGLPVPIEVALVDSCGKTMDSGAVVATFSNSDPPLGCCSIGPRLTTLGCVKP